MVHLRAHERLIERWIELGLGRREPVIGGFSLTPLGKLVHQQMLAAHYLDPERSALEKTMRVRESLGRRYRGY